MAEVEPSTALDDRLAHPARDLLESAPELETARVVPSVGTVVPHVRLTGLNPLGVVVAPTEPAPAEPRAVQTDLLPKEMLDAMA